MIPLEFSSCNYLCIQHFMPLKKVCKISMLNLGQFLTLLKQGKRLKPSFNWIMACILTGHDPGNNHFLRVLLIFLMISTRWFQGTNLVLRRSIWINNILTPRYTDVQPIEQISDSYSTMYSGLLSIQMTLTLSIQTGRIKVTPTKQKNLKFFLRLFMYKSFWIIAYGESDKILH